MGKPHGRTTPSGPFAGGDDVIRAIIQIEMGGGSLKTTRVRKKNWPLAAAAIRHFGCWGKALAAAGVDPELVANRRKWTIPRVIDTIHDLDRRGIALNYDSVRQVDRGLPQAARKLLGSWNDTLRAAGYDPNRIRVNRRPWTRDQIIDLIRDRVAVGLPVASYNVKPASAEVASRRLFGSWRAAIKAAGVPNPSVRHPVWTKVNVIESILIRQQKGAPLNSRAVAQQESRLYDGARRCFGGWEEALREAGIDPQKVRRRRKTPWTRKEVIEQLRQCNGAVQDVRRSACHSNCLVKAARELFGSWRQTLQAARITPLGRPAKPVGKITSGKRPRPRKTKRISRTAHGPRNDYKSKGAVIQAVLQREARGASLNARAVKQEDLSLYLAAMRYVGIWKDTLRAVGIDPESVGRQREWTAQRILEEIQRSERRGVALNAKAVSRSDTGLFQAATRYWGSWQKALEAAGFDASAVRAMRPAWTETTLIKAIRAHADSGKPVMKTAMKPVSIRRAADRLFGSFEAAIKASGVMHRRNLPFRWSQTAVIDAIRQRQQKGKPLNSKAVTQDNGGLYDAARQFCGNWNQALRAAGIDPDQVRLVRRRWTSESVMAAHESEFSPTRGKEAGPGLCVGVADSP